MDFKSLELSDKSVIDSFLSQNPPKISELTFTNLFMWRLRYKPLWRIWNDNLILILQDHNGYFALPPIGLGDKSKALSFAVAQLSKFSTDVRIGRVDKEFVHEYVDTTKFKIMEDRDNSDYVYLAEDLIRLPGNRFHAKKNHINKFLKKHNFEYRRLENDIAQAFLELQEDWCELKDCLEDLDLAHEDRAIYEAITNYGHLGFKGGAIIIDSKVEAFALGELLNPETAVIHVEKANPEIPGLYAVINQKFCEAEWSNVKFINREQDLGIEGLRKAKLSYHPHHMVEKFTLLPK